MSDSGDDVKGALARLGVEHEWMEIDPAKADTAVFCEAYDVPLENSANAIVVASKKEPKTYCACLVLATTRLDVNRRVRKLMGVPKASFATAEEMHALTGMEVGGVTPFGLPADLPLYVDRRVMDRPWIIVGAGSRAAKVKLVPAELQKLPAVEVVDELAKA